MSTETPYLTIDVARLQRNLLRTAEWAADHGVALRSHAKTHKCLEIARRQIDSGAIGLTVATIGEAEAFLAAAAAWSDGTGANASIDDIFIAYPLWLTPQKAARLHFLSTQCALRVGVDSIVGARRLGELLGPDSGIEVIVEVDSGQHRTGVSPERAGDVAVAAAAAGFDVVGVFTFPGHGYGPGTARSDAAGQESIALAQAADSLRAVGIEPRVRSGGSTPTAAYADTGVLTEIRPGVYPFYDAQQLTLGACDAADVALWAMATVVHRTGDRIVVDAGSKILGADRPAWVPGFGLCEVDGALIPVGSLSEHHAVIDLPTTAAASGPQVGSVVRVMPNHVCTAVNLVDELIAVDVDGVTTGWPVDARGCNS